MTSTFAARRSWSFFVFVYFFVFQQKQNTNAKSSRWRPVKKVNCRRPTKKNGFLENRNPITVKRPEMWWFYFFIYFLIATEKKRIPFDFFWGMWPRCHDDDVNSKTLDAGAAVGGSTTAKNVFFFENNKTLQKKAFHVTGNPQFLNIFSKKKNFFGDVINR